MPMEQFSQHLLPSLLSLSSDPVANVRVLVAKALRQSVMEKGKLHSKPVTDAVVCVRVKSLGFNVFIRYCRIGIAVQIFC